jgi:hypothetical protein
MGEERLPSVEQVLDPSHELISSRRVEGTAVYDPSGEKLGTIRSLMIMKRSGQVAYALLSLGGMLGLAPSVYPIPWSILRYDVDRDGYVAELTREQIERAPSMTLDAADRPRERSEDQMLYTYYGVLPPWGGVP